MPVRDATAALVRMLELAFTHQTVTFVTIYGRDWVSGTLSATRHRLSLDLTGADAPKAAHAFCDGVGEREFDLGRYILADIAVTQSFIDGGVRLTVEALTVAND